MRKTIVGSLLVLLVLYASAARALGDRPPPEPDWNYQGQWWSAEEPGWAIGISHQYGTLYATWFTYDEAGLATWFVMPGVRRRGYGWTYDELAGTIYSARAGSELVAVGTATFGFVGDQVGTFRYTINGQTQVKTIGKQLFAGRIPTCALGYPQNEPNYTDQWEGDDPHTGVNIAHQGQVIFATLFRYRANGSGEWIVIPGARLVDGKTFAGPIYRTRGPAFNAPAWSPKRVQATHVGEASFTFYDGFDYDQYVDLGYAKFEYTLDGVSDSMLIDRRIVSAPVSTCR